jgi:hypothetical protein
MMIIHGYLFKPNIYKSLTWFSGDFRNYVIVVDRDDWFDSEEVYRKEIDAN